jgi:hypothetical protein
MYSSKIALKNSLKKKIKLKKDLLKVGKQIEDNNNKIKQA